MVDEPVVRNDRDAQREGPEPRCNQDEPLTAPVAPEPQKITPSSSVPPTQSRMMPRASSRNRVVRKPVPDVSVCVGVERKHLVPVVILDEGQGPARCGVIGVVTRRGPDGTCRT